MLLSVVCNNSSFNRLNISVPEGTTTWGQLKSFLQELYGQSIDSFKATYVARNSNLNNVSPETDNALIPETNFAIALSPVSAKFGSISYAEMKAYIKDCRNQAVVAKNEGIISLIGDYTRLSTNEMTRLYNTLVSQNQTTVEPSDAFQQLLEKVSRQQDEILAELASLKEAVLNTEDEDEDDEDNDYDEDENEEEEVDEDVLAARNMLRRY